MFSKKAKSTKVITVSILVVALLVLGTSCTQAGEPPSDVIEVNFYLNDGTDHLFTTISGVPGETSFLPGTVPQRPGYEFRSWYLDPEGNTLYSDGHITIHPPTDGSFNVYAGWYTVFTVDFFCEYTEIPSLDVVENDLIQRPNDPMREGYIFDGWYKDSGFEYLWDFNNDRVTEDIKLYAHWIEEEPPITYTVTFNSNGGSAVNAFTGIEPFSAIPKPDKPSRDGFTFAGWFRDEKLSIPWDFEADLVDADITLYARWTEKPVGYTVKFNTNGGNEIAPQTKVPRDSLVTKPNDPTKAGYTFEGWYSNRDLTKKWDFANNKVTGDMTLYAKWGSDKTYTVNFDSDGGSAVASQSNLKKNSLITKPNDPSKANYNFTGWFTDKNYTKMWDFGYDRVNADMTLFARWEAVTPAPIPTPDPIMFNMTIDPGDTGLFEAYVVRVKKGDMFQIPFHSIEIPGGFSYVWFTSTVGVFSGGEFYGPAEGNVTFVAQNPMHR